MEGMNVEDMDVDVLITVGGDGTILRSLQLNNAPILGINAGVLGFLTEIPKDGIADGMKRLINGQYILEERMRLKTVVGSERLPDALNEGVIHTAHVAKIRQFEVYVDEELVVDTRADGIIVATPTGSTCYAMSVGAPIVDPRVNALVIAPMAPFKFSARPFVVPSTSCIRIELVRRRPCVLVLDGQDELPLNNGEEIKFTRSEHPARFVNLGSSFYSRTREKLIGYT
jgi:NAD+ kinase